MHIYSVLVSGCDLCFFVKIYFWAFFRLYLTVDGTGNRETERDDLQQKSLAGIKQGTLPLCSMHGIHYQSAPVWVHFNGVLAHGEGLCC